MATKYTKSLQNIPNGHKIDKLLPLNDPPKFIYVNWDFGLKIYHLAIPELSFALRAGLWG
jgi:hypothetical protein